MNKLKKDMILILSFLIAAFFIWLFPSFFEKEGPALVKVIQDGQETGAYSLLEDQTVFIPWGDENYNLLFISGGEPLVLHRRRGVCF